MSHRPCFAPGSPALASACRPPARAKGGHPTALSRPSGPECGDLSSDPGSFRFLVRDTANHAWRGARRGARASALAAGFGLSAYAHAAPVLAAPGFFGGSFLFLVSPRHPESRPGYLGVSLRDLDAAEATRLSDPPANARAGQGAMIVTVDRDAPAWASGLRPKDIIVEMNGQPVSDVEALRNRLRACHAEDTITLRVRRRDEEMSVGVTLGDQVAIAQSAVNRHLRLGGPASGFAASTDMPGSFGLFASGAPAPAPAPAPASPPTAESSRGIASTLFDALLPGSIYTGLEVDALTPQLAAFFGVKPGGGLLVTAVNRDSPASTAGLAAGDVIVRAANKPVSTRSRLARALHGSKGNAIPLAIMRDHQEMVLSLLPGKRKPI